MNRHTRGNPNSSQSDDFAAFADAVVNGSQPDAQSGIEATFLQVQRALGPALHVRSSMPPTERATLKENLMRTILTPSTRLPSFLPDTKANWAPGARPTGHAWRPVQAALSIAAVFALLVATSALVYERGFRASEPAPQGDQHTGQTIYDGDGTDGFLMAPADCVASGPVQGDSVFVDKSINDWPAPEYGPAQLVSREIQERVSNTYLGFIRCAEDAYGPEGDVTPRPGDENVVRTYYSDRMRLLELYVRNSPDIPLSSAQRSDIREYQCQSQNQQPGILASFPLPVNQPKDVVSLAQPGEEPAANEAVGFSPSDVYRLPDGRFGAVMGQISQAYLGNPGNADPVELLTFIAFVEKDGMYFIDEVIPLSSNTVYQPDSQNPDPSRGCGNHATPAADSSF